MPEPAKKWQFSPGDWSWSVSLEDFHEFDPSAVIGSPRSVETCRAEGFEWQDLVYRPLEVFQDHDTNPKVARLRHDFCEARRQDLLVLARDARAASVANEELGKAPADPFDEVWKRLNGPDFCDCPNTMAFFKRSQARFSRHTQAFTLPSQQSSGSLGAVGELAGEEDGELDEQLFQHLRAAGSLGNTDKVEEQPELLSTDLFSRSGSLHLRSTVSEPLLRSKLSELRAAPYSSHVDEEMVRKTEDLLLTQRGLDARKQKAAHADRLHSIKKIVELERSGVDKALKSDERLQHMHRYRTKKLELSEDERTKAFRQYKNLAFAPDGSKIIFSPEGSEVVAALIPGMRSKRGARPQHELDVPSLRGTPTGAERAAHWEECVRQNNLRSMMEAEHRRGELLIARTKDSQERLERVMTENTARSLQSAQDKLQARITWRHNYRDSLEQREQHLVDRADAFHQKEERFAQWLRLSSDATEMRAELRELRRIHRLQSARQRLRKEQYWLVQRQEKEAAVIAPVVLLQKPPVPEQSLLRVESLLSRQR
mmetsp:Transcript_2315/g.5303  ORF Transcript_2315/g.5303 Transcript_2315/m.5303 type:complete len:541 (+) Transcript_2315:55-1677(+)